MKADSNRLRWGLVWLAIGLALVGAQQLFDYTRNFTAVDIPVQKTPATIHTGTFTLNYPGLYLIEYRVTRTLPGQELRCRLGVEDLRPERCPKGQPHVETSWTLRDDSGPITHGDSDRWTEAESSKDDLSAEIGTFRGGSFAGKQYSLDVTIRNNVPALEKPALVVEIHPISTKESGTLLYEAMMFVFGTIFLIIGLFQTARGIWEIAFDRRTDRLWSTKS